ncbi:bifunctional folylpolyglutamate synthase/dihydrofolate synthase [Rathayibacter rathayi]|uniref:tetrahydrofolate synthase n=1 Tax=Rathayibacter rathayi TaxID=33887 RepID=A0ABX5AC60_RATRA|nr:folylpolyglutamate synthase/dihydrofolate synthase family protein [Rathayibacter rathayi]AZZ48854.1 bifunctional folylpolyglutamate synthase/dihydrofolate synthase [Rathayibacter rathayi]MWV73947.1 dihydrofolate synthase [Rathayibacter rathayi NCPPB 2980 = VKM Ac-1601]PPF24777.1 bifunctional folylpolyglutamate synthase/dihydrofolate synthase [Rathayibacter rathayi]PPF49545.1 bifunctional folylpolyglutamate synthase/dihydrofolate synthase [Rathayibacter rathayi]PPG71419.1 bifunctional folylp
MSDPFESDDADRAAADAVYAALLERLGESSIRPRLAPTRRAVEILGDPQRAYPVIQIAGTNGKTSTSRMIESLLRAHGLRVGLFTSPHLERFNERIVIDGEPISDRRLADNWQDVEPYLRMTDAELAEQGEAPLSFFEAITVLAYAAFADTPVDVAVVEVGMGGEWDSTNVADAQVAVFTPIALDHRERLGSSIEEIARTKSGIVKPLASVVSAQQVPEAEAVLRHAAAATESSIVVEGVDFDVESTTVAVGGQVVTVRGVVSTYEQLLLPIFGDHQAQNAAVAVAAVETFLGGGTQELTGDVLDEGFAAATSPGRLQLVGLAPRTIVDAAHNPHGAASLAAALGRYFDFDRVTAVLGVLAEKDAEGILRELRPVVDELIVTTAPSGRAMPADQLAALARTVFPEEAVRVADDPLGALTAGRVLAARTEKGALLVTGSITLVGRTITAARDENWLGS